jgi:hypothetical protein
MGIQLAGKAHARFAVDTGHTGFVAVGYSQGRHVQDDGRFRLLGSIGHDDTVYLARRWSTARWLDFEAGYEYQARDGLSLRFYAGAGKLLNAGAGVDDERPQEMGTSYRSFEETETSTLVPYLGTSLGHAF